MANSRPAAGLLALHRETVLAEWVDYNGHMNVAFYVLAFDHATDAVLDRLDLGGEYRRRTGNSNFVVEGHVTYRREVHEGDELRFTTQVLGFDDKRLHLFHHMYSGPDDAVVATNEIMLVNVDMNRRRATPVPAAELESIKEIAAAHALLPRPPEAGRAIAPVPSST